MILLVTNQRDLTMDYIVRELKVRGISYFRLNTERLPYFKCRLGYKNIDDWSIDNITGHDIKAAYFRRPGIPEPKETSLGSDVVEYMRVEWLAFLKSLYSRLDDKWFNSPTNIVLAEDKPKQLLLANQIGFNIPDNVITNDVNSAIEISNKFELIAKPLKQALIEDDSEKVIFTNRISKIDNNDENSINYCPIIFQQEIRKKYDIRVTVIGSNIFPVAIWSQSNSETSVDWRRGGHIDLKHELIKLPYEIKKMCLELTKLLNLNFGAIDLILDENDKYWFLEINPNGQWAWIENRTNIPLSKYIVDELIKISEKCI